MYTATVHQRRSNFTHVNSYTVYDEQGHLHLGRTIRNYLSRNRITSTEFSAKIGLTRGGLTHLLAQRGMNTERLEQISKVLDYDFFKVFSGKVDDDLKVVHEPAATYEPQRSRLVVELEDGKVVSSKKDDGDDMLRQVLEAQQRQWDLLVSLIPDLAKKMAGNPALNPNNMDISDLTKPESDPRD